MPKAIITVVMNMIKNFFNKRFGVTSDLYGTGAEIIIL